MSVNVFVGPILHKYTELSFFFDMAIKTKEYLQTLNFLSLIASYLRFTIKTTSTYN